MQSLVNDVHHLSTKVGEENRQGTLSHVYQAQSSISQLAMLAGSEAGLLAGYDGYTGQVATIEVFSSSQQSSW